MTLTAAITEIKIVMELQLSPEDAAFRDEVRDFFRENLAPDLQQKVELSQELGKQDIVRWHKVLLARGWAAPNWPAAFGGPGWSPMQKHIFDDELAAASAPAGLQGEVAVAAQTAFVAGLDAAMLVAALVALAGAALAFLLVRAGDLHHGPTPQDVAAS